MTYPPNIVTILGSSHTAVGAAFQKLFKFDVCPGTMLIIDYAGRGAVLLSESNKMSLLKKDIRWFDLGDRRHTLQLFQVNNSPHIRNILQRTYDVILNATGNHVSDETLNWLIKTAAKYSEDGPINLLTLLRLLSIPEVKQLYAEAKVKQEEISTIQNALTWTLKFPLVYAISNGVNQVDLEYCFSDKTVIWIELPYEHLEKNEHYLLSGFVDIAVEDAIKNFYDTNPNSKLDITVLHVYPPQKPFPILPQWIKDRIKNVRHVSVHNYQPSSPIKKLTNEWIRASENIWITGKIGPIKRSMHNTWLTDKEMDQIEALDDERVWVKSNKVGKAITAHVKTFEQPPNLPHRLRVLSNRNKKLTSISQMGSEVDSLGLKTRGITGLYDRLCDKELLTQGWHRVKSGRADSHGIDKITIKEFGNNIEKELDELRYELRQRKYKCRPLRRVYLEKPEGGTRDIGVACVRDRVVQTSCLILLEPFFEPYFSNYSFAYRPRRDAHQALSLVRSRIRMEYEWAVTSDIKKCFDSIDHNVLLEFIERKIADADILNLIKHLLYVEVLEFNELLPTILGVPQGESLSPLLSNIYLDPLDKHLENLGYSFVRYADDIIIQTKTKEEAERALFVLKNFLMEPLHLEIKPAKTNFAFVEDGFEFLGFKIKRDTISIRDKKITSVWEVIEKQVKILAEKSSTMADRTRSLLKTNSAIRGFRNYFMLPDESAIQHQLELLDGQVENLGRLILPPEIKDDPVWICRERFHVSINLNDIESYEEEALRKAKTENEYPQENIYDAAPNGLIKDDIDDKASIIIENSSKESHGKESQGDGNKNIRDTIFELNQRLYVMTHGSYLTLDGNDLIVKKNKSIIARYTLDKLGLVFLQGYGMNIAVSLQLKLAELDIPVVFAPTVGTPLAIVSPIFSTKSHLRRLQIIRRDDPDIIHAGLSILAAKVANQSSLLKYFSKYRKKIGSPSFSQIIGAADSVKEIAAKILGLHSDVDDVRTLAMGYEGHAASIYWQAIKKLLPSDFEFVGRITRGAKDAVNQCFNYVYGLLYGEVWRAIVKTGLDPYFGFIHGSKRDGGSMIFDVIEEFRSPFADRIVVSIFGRGFHPDINREGLLKTSSKKLLAKCFSKKWHGKIKWRSSKLSPAQILEHQAESLSKLLSREGKYYPYKMSW